MEQNIRNVVLLQSWFSCKFAVIDTDDELWISEFLKRSIPCKVNSVYAKGGTAYKVFFLQIPKKYSSILNDISEQVYNTRILMGFKDYQDACDKYLNILKE